MIIQSNKTELQKSINALHEIRANITILEDLRIRFTFSNLGCEYGTDINDMHTIQPIYETAETTLRAKLKRKQIRFYKTLAAPTLLYSMETELGY
jgi:hypothetical protein